MDIQTYRKILTLFLILTLFAILLMACEQKDKNASGKVYKGTSTGYDGELTVKITIRKDGFIEVIKVEGNDKNSEIGGPAITELAKNMLSKQNISVDGVSGATSTSNGMLEAAKSAFSKSGINVSSKADKTIK